MNRFVTLTVAMCCFVPQLNGDDEGALEQIQGTWEIVAGERDGRKFVDTELVTCDKYLLYVKGTSFGWCSSRSKVLSSGKCDEFKTKEFARVVFTIHGGANVGDRSCAIFEVKDGELKICYSDGHRSWPESFDTKGKEGYATIVYRKKKLKREE